MKTDLLLLLIFCSHSLAKAMAAEVFYSVALVIKVLTPENGDRYAYVADGSGGLKVVDLWKVQSLK